MYQTWITSCIGSSPRDALCLLNREIVCDWHDDEGKTKLRLQREADEADGLDRRQRIGEK